MLKYVTVISVVAALCAGAPQQYQPEMLILRFDLDMQIDGYMVDETSDGTSGQEEGSPDNTQSEDASFTASGQYSYVDSDGVQYTVTFTDGPNGLQQTINA